MVGGLVVEDQLAIIISSRLYTLFLDTSCIILMILMERRNREVAVKESTKQNISPSPPLLCRSLCLYRVERISSVVLQFSF